MSKTSSLPDVHSCSRFSSLSTTNIDEHRPLTIITWQQLRRKSLNNNGKNIFLLRTVQLISKSNRFFLIRYDLSRQTSKDIPSDFFFHQIQCQNQGDQICCSSRDEENDKIKSFSIVFRSQFSINQ